MARVFDWVSKVWQHLNKFLEAHSFDVTIGPRLFLPSPTDLVPYVLEAVREGLQLNGRRAPRESYPTVIIVQIYPWTEDAVHSGHEALHRLRAEDVGYDMHPVVGGGTSMRSISSTHSDAEGDPLILNMLMGPQEVETTPAPQ